jgi:glycosyltransferase involved in cell wall biosynthesis
VKIAYLFSRYPVPSQTFCDTEMRALEQRGAEIEIYTCSPPAASFRHEPAGRPRGPVFYAPPERALDLVRLSAIARGVWPQALISEHETRFGADRQPARRALHAVAFAATLERRGIDHIHVHFANRATHAALFIQALTGIPFSFTAHGQDFLVDLANDALLAEFCARAAFVVTVSDFSRQALLEKCPAAAGKIERIYHGLALDRWPAALPAARPENGGLRIFSGGRLIDFKGFTDLIAACALLRERDIAFTCEIAGEGPSHDALAGQIAALGLRGTVRLLGLVSQGEMRSRFAECDVFALAAKMDAKGACDVLPTVILEAMAAGRPVISTRLAGIPELVADGRTGMLVPPGDPGSLADALATLAADAILRERLGQAGRTRLEACFTAARAATRLETLFARSGHAARPGQPREAAPGLVLLLDAWPAATASSLEAWLGAAPETRILAMGMGQAGEPPPAGIIALTPTVDFLPDAMVLEAEWRECPREAHRIESWRSELASALETADYLEAARRALYLHHRWQREPGPLHLHACGPAALLCAWLWLRLDPTRAASFSLLPAAHDKGSLTLPNSLLRRLAPAFSGGWLPGAKRLAAELGASFHGDPLSPETNAWNLWKGTVLRWADRPQPSPPAPLPLPVPETEK